MQLSQREYTNYLTMKDMSRATVHKKRRCFNYGTQVSPWVTLIAFQLNILFQYFHLDIYVKPLPPACEKPLKILETYTTQPVGSNEPELPVFLKIEREITGEKGYSMYELSRTVHHQPPPKPTKAKTPKEPIQNGKSATL
jgi:hypothetical protein